MPSRWTGHLCALATMLVWGSTYVATKVLLEQMTPLWIMSCRFLVAAVVLTLLRPRWEGIHLKQEARCALLACFGCTLYFLCENTALSYTLASNVSILVAAAPMLTALLARLFIRGTRLGRRMWLGFLAAFGGVILVVFNGAVVLKLNPLGDAISLGAALMWAIYGILLARYAGDMHPITLTARMNVYAFLMTLPLALAVDKPMDFSVLLHGSMAFCLLYLGVVGSGLCYVMWSVASRALGPVTTNNYIYTGPFITLLTASVTLGEPMTLMAVAGAALIILGVVVSNGGGKPAQDAS